MTVGGRKLCKKISDDVKGGNIAYNINKPYSYIGYALSSHLGSCTIKALMFSILGIITGLVFMGDFPKLTIASCIMVIITAIFATVINTLLIIFIGLISFFIEDANPFYWVYSKFILVLGTIFPIEYFPKSVGMLLTHLCTYDEHLIQGAPTSSYISNLVLKDFDEELGYWCKEKGVSYTRYSDDLTFSGDLNVRKIIKKVRKMLYEVGLELNDEKTKVINQSQNQNVTGITVNKKMQVNIKYRKKIRQEVFYIKKYGLNNHLNKINYVGKEDSYLKQLYGRTLFVLQINRTKEFENYKKYIFNLIKDIQ